MSRMRRVRILLAAFSALALGGLAVWWLALRDAPAPVSVVEAIAGFREAGEAGAGAETARVRGEPLLEGVTRGTGGLDLWLEPSTGLVVRQVTWNDNVTDAAIGE